MSSITTPLARKRPFHWISMRSRLVRAARETSKFQNWSHLTKSRRGYMAEILLIAIRRKTLSNQSINQSINHILRVLLVAWAVMPLLTSSHLKHVLEPLRVDCPWPNRWHLKQRSGFGMSIFIFVWYNPTLTFVRSVGIPNVKRYVLMLPLSL